jgi:hypothetical protein
MCFSATASFSAGGVLLGIGALTLKAARRPCEWAFAAIPLLFAIQQLIEGVIWLTFSADTPLLNSVMTHAYSFFSHVLWPVYLPMAVLMIEPSGGRRRTLKALVLAGSAIGIYLLYVLVAFPVVSRPTGQHVEYDSPHFFAAAVQVFGALVLLSFGAAYYFYATWFISVWCFFAALLSTVIYLHFAWRPTQRGGSHQMAGFTDQP